MLFLGFRLLPDVFTPLEFERLRSNKLCIVNHHACMACVRVYLTLTILLRMSRHGRSLY